VDGGSSGRVIRVTNGGVIDGFTIRGGRVGSGGTPGAGICVEGSGLTTIRNNTVESNIAGTAFDGRGGGIGCYNSSVTIEHNIIRYNQAHEGGGLYVFTTGPPAHIRDNTIVNNIAGFVFDSGTGGGGNLVGTSITAESNVITDNIAGDAGAGLEANGENIAILNNMLARNSCHVSGAGARVSGGMNVRVAGNVVLDNHADSFSGGLELDGPLLIESNTVVGNRTLNSLPHGAGITMRHSSTFRTATLRQNLVVGNHGASGGGAGIHCGGNVQMDCNDSWSNDSDYSTSGACAASGARNVSLDPLFCNEPADDYHIANISPCSPSLSLGCGLIGALPVACGATLSTTQSWGALKIRYR
jgi:hypothetical protein